MQISNLTILFMGLNVLLSLAIPLGLLLVLRRRYGGGMIPFVMGCVTFVLFAMVLEAKMHRMVLGGAAGQIIQGNLILYALYGGLMAGLFEETGRLIAMKGLQKKDDRPEAALFYGAGHGGIEAFLVMGLTMVNYIVYAVMSNAGQLEQLLAPLDETNRAALTAIVAQLAESSPFLLLYSPMERISAVILHISLSVLVWRAAVKPGSLRFYILAVALHALMDILAAILAGVGLPTALVETLLLAFALATAVYAKKVYHAMTANLA